MTDGRRFSVQTIAVLAALLAEPPEWRHGYDIAKQTGLKSGTLYPILVRLADRQLVEATWEAEQPVGRPRRHLYRLTANGLAEANAVAASSVTSSSVTSSSVTTRGRQPRGVPHRLGLGGAR